MDDRKIYYSGNGGAFRIFIAKNSENYFIPHLDDSLSIWEKQFILGYAKRLGFNNNLFNFNGKTFKENCQYEWYDLSDDILNAIIKNKKEIRDIYDNIITTDQLQIASYAAKMIRNKNTFYKIINQILPNNFVTNWRIINDITLLKDYSYDFIYPVIIKSCNGKGGKGNIICNNPLEIQFVEQIFSSSLFAKKQENHVYNIKDEIIVERFFPNCPSYNLSFYCTPNGKMENANIAEQIIEEVFYRGNMYPTQLNEQEQKNIYQMGNDICHYINNKLGYLGWIGLDFIKINDKICVIEANPRINSVTHAYNLVQGNAFIIRLMKYQEQNRKQIFCKFYFNQLTKTGILPYQLPNRNEALIISIAPRINEAKMQLKNFITETKMCPTKQLQVSNYSKSLSYYLLNKSEFEK